MTSAVTAVSSGLTPQVATQRHDVTEMAGEYGVPVAAGFAIDDPGMPPLWPWLEVSRSVPALADVLGEAAGSVGSGALDGTADSASARVVMFAAASGRTRAKMPIGASAMTQRTRTSMASRTAGSSGVEARGSR